MGSDWEDFAPDVPWPDDSYWGQDDWFVKSFSPVLGETGGSVAGTAVKAAAVGLVAYGLYKLLEGPPSYHFIVKPTIPWVGKKEEESDKPEGYEWEPVDINAE